jgi:hypothetical protein
MSQLFRSCRIRRRLIGICSSQYALQSRSFAREATAREALMRDRVPLARSGGVSRVDPYSAPVRAENSGNVSQIEVEDHGYLISVRA